MRFLNSTPTQLPTKNKSSSNESSLEEMKATDLCNKHMTNNFITMYFKERSFMTHQKIVFYLFPSFTNLVSVSGCVCTFLCGERDWDFFKHNNPPK